MHYSRRKNYNCSPPITLHDFDGNTRTIATDKTTRWLGVHFDRKFLFNHVKMLAARGFIAVNLLYMLANTVRGLSHASLRRLYLSAISPKLLYACLTWWNDKKCQAKLLDKVQRRALIICTCFNRLSWYYCSNAINSSVPYPQPCGCGPNWSFAPCPSSNGWNFVNFIFAKAMAWSKNGHFSSNFVH